MAGSLRDVRVFGRIVMVMRMYISDGFSIYSPAISLALVLLPELVIKHALVLLPLDAIGEAVLLVIRHAIH